MSNTIQTKFTRAQLLADLQTDGIFVNYSTPNLKPGDTSSAIGSYYLTAQNFGKAFAWYQEAIKENHSGAYASLGWLYRTGQGVRIDFHMAMDLYIKSADLNNPGSFVNIGELFEFGYGVPTDKYKALEWYKKDVRFEKITIKIENEGVHLSPQDKDKPLLQLLMETKAILNSEKLKAATAEEDKTKLLEDKIQAMSIVSPDEQKEISPTLQSNQRLEQKIHKLEDQIQELTSSKTILYQQLQVNKADINLLRQENQLLKIAQDLPKIQQLLDTEKKKHGGKLEEEIKRLKREVEEYKTGIKKPTLSKDVIKNENSNSAASLNHEADTVNDGEDINYDTPDEDDDNNDINYDGPN